MQNLKELNQEEWLYKGERPYTVIINENKIHVFIYYNILFSFRSQMAKGWGKDYYGYIGGSLLKNDGSIIVENGMTKFLF